jgi:hypothetical protein
MSPVTTETPPPGVGLAPPPATPSSTPGNYTTTADASEGGVSRFTPGPWEAEPQTGRGAWIKGSDGEWAALSCGDTDERGRANAHLIAAAPDLYEALAGVIPANVCLTNMRWPDDTVVPCDVTLGELRKAAAALAKARGES